MCCGWLAVCGWQVESLGAVVGGGAGAGPDGARARIEPDRDPAPDPVLAGQCVNPGGSVAISSSTLPSSWRCVGQSRGALGMLGSPLVGQHRRPRSQPRAGLTSAMVARHRAPRSTPGYPVRASLMSVPPSVGWRAAAQPAGSCVRCGGRARLRPTRDSALTHQRGHPSGAWTAPPPLTVGVIWLVMSRKSSSLAPRGAGC